MLAELSSAPWIHRQVELLTRRMKVHATQAYLLTGAQNVGQIELGVAWAQSLLCLQPVATLACQKCASCTLFKQRAHPDFYLLIPAKLNQEWFPDAEGHSSSSKRKPHSMVGSEILVEDMHKLLEFSHITASLTDLKIALIYPAENMNHISANAFLKTLEEPSGKMHFILCTQQRAKLLPTILSRCSQYQLQSPTQAEAHQWLLNQGLEASELEVFWRASGKRAQEAWVYAKQLKIQTQQWQNLPKALQQGEMDWLLQLPKALIVQIMFKVCHDVWLHQIGCQPRFFLATELPKAVEPQKLLKWYKILLKYAQHQDVAFDHELLMLNLRLQAQQALN